MAIATSRCKKQGIDIVFCDVMSIRSHPGLIGALFSALEVTDVQALSNTALVAELRSRERMLLYLDNLEQLPPISIHFLNQLVTETPACSAALDL